MSPHSLPMRLRWFDRLSFVSVLVLLVGVAWLPAQETQPAAQKSAAQQAASEPRDQRLEAIEKSLQTLLKEVQSLRQPAAAPQPPAASTQTTTATTAATANPDFELDAKWLKSLNWRSIGPANMGGRITDFAINESDSSMWWVATASGGLLKTIN